jgi:tRNA (guanine37-N1)-methyltransferase
MKTPDYSETIKIWVLSMFPDMLEAFSRSGVIGKVLQGERTEKKISIKLIHLKDFSPDGFKGIDDSPYGGGPGMVMRADVLRHAIEKAILVHYPEHVRISLKRHFHIIYTSPRGKAWNNNLAKDFCREKFCNNMDQKRDIIFICGRYEGIDERFLELYVTEQYSLGDFILSGGEIAIMAILDSSIRFLDGALGDKTSAQDESFEDGLLEYPHYTRPAEFEGETVPPVLLSGNHQKILNYRHAERLRMTRTHRPDLWQQYEEDKKHNNE